MEEIYNRFSKDRFAKMCGMEIEEISEGYARTSMLVEDRHLNGVDIAQGGAIFTLADLAFACASNSHGPVAVSINISVSFLKAVGAGERLVAEAKEISLHKRLGVYEIEVRSGEDLVAKLTGTVYRRT
ncbi:MAG TPA: hydroxyphenylacetyl-CoA thioesterase PaaI [Clostridia bacterium]|jgi:acyl-CoA thioesterase|nr:hydroxyphenylacetyl-CoA thioesterase PaaI [Clostridia bacterium]